MENAITSLQDLKAWFISAESPFFTLYRGTEVKQGNTVAKNDVTSDMTQAWALLEKQITSLSKHGAVIFVHARKKNDNTTTGLSTVFAYNPFATQMYNSSSIGSMLPAPTPQPQGLSIGEVQKMVDEKVRSERERWERDREIDDLKGMIQAIQEEQMKPMAMIKEALNHPLVASIGSILIAKVAGIDPALLAGLQGQGEHTSDDMPVDEPENEIFNEAYANFERAGFKPDEIKKLSLWALKNKDIAKSMFQQTQFS